jgi:hypothetical protein
MQFAEDRRSTRVLNEETEREYNEAATDYDVQHGLSNWKYLFTTKASRYHIHSLSLFGPGTDRV